MHKSSGDAGRGNPRGLPAHPVQPGKPPEQHGAPAADAGEPHAGDPHRGDGQERNDHADGNLGDAAQQGCAHRAEAPVAALQAVGQMGKPVKEADDIEIADAGGNDGGILAEQGHERRPEQQHDRADAYAGGNLQEHALEVALVGAGMVLGAFVLRQEGGDGDGDAAAGQEADILNLPDGAEGGRGGDAQGVHAALDNDVADGLAALLQRGEDPVGQGLAGEGAVDPDLPPGKAQLRHIPGHVADAQHGADPLGHGGGERGAEHTHPEPGNERQVQHDIDHAGHDEVSDGRLRIADGTKRCGIDVVQAGKGHAQEDDAHIDVGIMHGLGLHVHQAEDRAGQRNARSHDEYGKQEPHGDRGADLLLQVLPIPGAEEIAHQHGGTDAHAGDPENQQGP